MSLLKSTPTYQYTHTPLRGEFAKSGCVKDWRDCTPADILETFKCIARETGVNNYTSNAIHIGCVGLEDADGEWATGPNQNGNDPERHYPHLLVIPKDTRIVRKDPHPIFSKIIYDGNHIDPAVHFDIDYQDDQESVVIYQYRERRQMNHEFLICAEIFSTNDRYY